MSMMIVLILSGVAMWVATNGAIWVSHRFNFYDIPTKRKPHAHPIPLLGGGALLVSIFFSMGMVRPWLWPELMIGLIGALFIFFIGLYDDKYTLSPTKKLSLQFLLVSGLFFFDIRIQFITWPFDASPIFFNDVTSFVITQIWMLTVINMVNMIDGIDGLAVGVSLLTSIVLVVVSISVSPVIVTYLLCSIIGSTSVFLRFNFFPAKIFLGDSGALLLGYLFALVSILGVLKSTISFFVFLFIFSIPFMDILLSIVRRLMNGHPIFHPDLEHMHHQLMRQGLSMRRSSLILYGISIVFGIVAITMAIYHDTTQLVIGTGLFLIVFCSFLLVQIRRSRDDRTG